MWVPSLFPKHTIQWFQLALFIWAVLLRAAPCLCGNSPQLRRTSFNSYQELKFHSHPYIESVDFTTEKFCQDGSEMLVCLYCRHSKQYSFVEFGGPSHLALDEKYCRFSLLGKESTVDSPPPLPPVWRQVWTTKRLEKNWGYKWMGWMRHY